MNDLRPATSAGTPASTAVPIVGRDRERATIFGALDHAIAGHGRLVLIGSEAGIGKTTLVGDVSRLAAQHGMLVLSGSCYDLTNTPPYGPWLQLSDGLSTADDWPEWPASLRRDSSVREARNQDELFDEVTTFLRVLAARQPLVLVLEDMHWSDVASLDLLRHIARLLGSVPVVVLVTYRVNDLTRDHPLFQLLPLLARESQTERIDLRRLGDVDVRALIERRYSLERADTVRLVQHLQSRADGNPLFLTELLRTLEDEHVLRPFSGGWTLNDLSQSLVPPLVEQIIEGRLRKLAPETRLLLAVAAVIGQEAPIELWSQTADATDAALLVAIEEAIAANFVQATPDGTAVRFVHALVREVFYDGILPIRRRRLHQQVAERLTAARQPNPDAVANHFQRAGDQRAIEWLIQAGDRAYRAYAWRTTIERFDAAAQLMAGDPGRARERGWLLYRTGRMLRMSNPADGVGRLQEAERVARAIGDDILAAYALADRGLARCFAGDIRRGIDEMAAGVAALDELPPDHLSRDPSIATWVADALRTDEPNAVADTDTADPPAPHNIRRSTLALWLATVGRHAEAIAMGEKCRDEVAGVTQLTELAAGSLGDAWFALGHSYAELGRRDEADAAFEQAREVYRGFDHHELVSGTATNHLWVVACPYFATNLARLRWLVAEAEAARSRSQGALGGAVAPASSGALALVFPTGEWVEARNVIDAALQQTNMTLRLFSVCAVAYIAWGQGDDVLAWQHIQETFADGPRTEPGGLNFSPALDLQRLAVTLALDGGDLDHARAWLESQDRWLAWGGAVRRQADAALLWARYHHASGDAEAARRHTVQALRLASDPAQPLVLLAAHRLASQLDTEAGQYADAEQHLQEALALADACAAPFERALTLLTRAELRAATGAIDEAQALVEQTRAICLPLGAQPTVARADALTARLITKPATPSYAAGLTAREVDVLRLVAQGLTDAEVAEQLFLARRTVNTHLTSIYTKLNVSSRAAATRFAVEHGLT